MECTYASQNYQKHKSQVLVFIQKKSSPLNGLLSLRYDWDRNDKFIHSFSGGFVVQLLRLLLYPQSIFREKLYHPGGETKLLS